MYGRLVWLDLDRREALVLKLVTHSHTHTLEREDEREDEREAEREGGPSIDLGLSEE